MREKNHEKKCAKNAKKKKITKMKLKLAEKLIEG